MKIKDSISSKILNKHVLSVIVETLSIELDFQKSKWLLVVTYHSPSQNDQYFFCFNKALDHYSSYGKVLSYQRFEYRGI